MRIRARCEEKNKLCTFFFLHNIVLDVRPHRSNISYTTRAKRGRPHPRSIRAYIVIYLFLLSCRNGGAYCTRTLQQWWSTIYIYIYILIQRPRLIRTIKYVSIYSILYLRCSIGLNDFRLLTKKIVFSVEMIFGIKKKLVTTDILLCMMRVRDNNTYTCNS